MRVRAIGSNVRRLREARGWTRAELPEAVDVALRYLQQIEHAAASPSLRRLVALSHALDVDVADLIAPGPVMPRRNPGRPRRRG
jgi:transcriptional regulator with XRE-family HTH domain